VTWPAHPDDELVEVTGFADIEPRYLVGRSYIGVKISQAASLYVYGSISFEEFERRVDDALAEATDKVP
jgi:hypothetical protein